jgi:hypothetical protein
MQKIVDDHHARIIRHPSIKNDSSAILSGGKGVNSKGQPRQVL